MSAENRGILASIQGAVMGLLIVVIMGEGVALWFGWGILEDAQERSDDLEQRIDDMIAAQALTERLREYNAEITREREMMTGEIEDAIGYNDPLPPDIVGVLERLRKQSNPIVGTP